MHRLYILLFAVVLLNGCAPKEPVTLREVHIRNVELGSNGSALLKADAVLYNPNKGSLRLKKIDLEIFVDDKPAGRIDQKLTAQIKAQSEFTVPLEVQIKVGESGFLDTVFTLLGGKKHTLRITGKLRVKVSGFPVSIPVDHKDEFKF